MTLDNCSPCCSSASASWLNGKASKALIVIALAAAACAISPSRVYAAQAGALTVVNKNNSNPTVIDWAPLVRGAVWQWLGSVPAGRKATFNITLPDGRLASPFGPIRTTKRLRTKTSIARATITSPIRIPCVVWSPSQNASEHEICPADLRGAFRSCRSAIGRKKRPPERPGPRGAKDTIRFRERLDAR